MHTTQMLLIYPFARDHGYEICAEDDTAVTLSVKIREWIGLADMNAGQAGTVADMAAARVFEQIEAGHFRPRREA